MSLEARTGRLRQRYDEDNFRLVSGCIPYRLTKDAEDQNENIVNKMEVLMVSSPNRSDLVFPKGGWENDETVVEAASREAFEEAGVKGILNENPLGVWEFWSKSRPDLHSLEGGCRGYMFALKVTEELEIWPEQENRYRKWLNIKDAFQLCRYEWMREALEEFLTVMAEERKIVEIEEEIVETLSMPPVSEVIAECQIMTSNCGVTTTSSPHHSISALSSFHWQISPLKRLPLS
ncbi:Nudix hydrolase [Melia azedarach]|uniref:Nudix hydrolase n=2 Tax=Melia azedarach TaxID=155640 RepID=A0ACC1Z2W3_MELAZ|nr:Nudix hydrolase [Melia azedarach]KAJ4729584.1 Nudix hydrolase [Melia azedarach]